MKKNMRILVICSGIMMSLCLLYAENFVVKKKKHDHASSALKEQCCQEGGAVLKQVPGILRSLADLQEIITDNLYAFFQGDKHALFTRSGKQHLEQVVTRLAARQKQMVSLQKAIESDISFFRSLTNNIVDTET